MFKAFSVTLRWKNSSLYCKSISNLDEE